MNKLQLILKGIVKENPTFVLVLGMCPTLGTTTSAANGFGMGVATMAVLILSNIVISLIKNFIPDKVRIPAFIVVIASFVTIVQMLMQAFVPALYATLGVFIPLIVVNCIILGRAEAFASKNNAFDSALDGLGIGLGFTLSLTVIGTIRELLGSGAVFGYSLGTADYMPLVFALCRKRNAREWMFRAVAETQHSRTVPYFITLTYNNLHRPSDGVNKEDVQKFLKRLRQILARDHNYTEEIRYFAAAEYGSHTKLPHYHLILWNMPIAFSAMDVYKTVLQAWSVRKRVYNKLTHRFDWEYLGELGFVYCKPCTQGGIQYCMKYMRKESDIPKGSNPTFYLSSRRGGGLGYKWCLDHVLWFYQHPDVLTIEIVDKFTGERFTSYIPSYFRRKLYPCPSMLVRKEIRDTIQLVDYFLSVRACLWQLRLGMADKEVNVTRKYLHEKFPFSDSYVHAWMNLGSTLSVKNVSSLYNLSVSSFCS